MNPLENLKSIEINPITASTVESTISKTPVVESFHNLDLEKPHIDGKTGFYVDEGNFHINIAKTLNTSLVNGENIAIFKVDLNDLKKTNDTFGHHVGDSEIIWSAQEMKTEFDSHFKDSLVKIIFTRQSSGGDEYVAYITGIQEKDLDILNTIKANLNNRDKGNYSSIFSVTSKFRTSLDEKYNDPNDSLVEREKQYIKDHPQEACFHFLDAVNSELDGEIVTVKDTSVKKKAIEPFENRNEPRESIYKKADKAVAKGRCPEGMVEELLNCGAEDLIRRFKSGEMNLEDYDKEGKLIVKNYTELPELFISQEDAAG
jgi:GGDEF domain-containing protein